MSELEKYRQTMSGEVLRSWAVDAQSEIDRLKAELETTRVQLAGCGVAAMCNTRESMAKQMCKPTDYGYSASYQDVLNAVNREIHLRETLEETQRQLAEARAELASYKAGVEVVAAVDKYGELHFSKDLPHMANQRVRVLVMKEGI